MKITMVCLLLAVLPVSFAETVKSPKGSENYTDAPPIPPGAKNSDLYEVTCINCETTFVQKPARRGISSSRAVAEGYMVQRTLLFKCPKCKTVFFEPLPEELVQRKPLRKVVPVEQPKKKYKLVVPFRSPVQEVSAKPAPAPPLPTATSSMHTGSPLIAVDGAYRIKCPKCGVVTETHVIKGNSAEFTCACGNKFVEQIR